MPDSEAYTRNGSLAGERQRRLQTRRRAGAGRQRAGHDPAQTITIGADGSVSALQPDQPGVVSRGRAAPAGESAEAQLVRGDDWPLPPVGAGRPPVDPNVRVAGAISRAANVNVVDQMVQMISLARQFEMQTRMLSTAEQNDRSAARVIGGQG